MLHILVCPLYVSVRDIPYHNTVSSSNLSTNRFFSEKKGLSFSLNKKGRKKRKKNQIYLKKVPWFLVKSHKKQYQSLINPLQKGWLYETLFRKNQSRHAKYFELDRPQTILLSVNLQGRRHWTWCRFKSTSDVDWSAPTPMEVAKGDADSKVLRRFPRQARGILTRFTLI